MMNNSPAPSSQLALFARQFRDDFFHVGAVLPSSPALGRAGAKYLARRQGPVRVLEAGAGTGAFTREIVPLLQPGDSLDMVEINLELLAYLKRRFETEPAFQVRPGVQLNFINIDLRHLPPTTYDYIIFSLPLTNFPPPLVQELLELMMARLKPGGVFSYVKYIFVSRFKYLLGSPQIKADMRANTEIINRFAARYQIEQQAVLFNIPPTWVYYWQKPASK